MDFVGASIQPKLDAPLFSVSMKGNNYMVNQMSGVNIWWSTAPNHLPDVRKPQVRISDHTHVSCPQHLKDSGGQGAPSEACLGTVVIVQIDASSYAATRVWTLQMQQSGFSARPRVK